MSAELNIMMYGTFIAGYSMYGFSLPKKLKKGTIFMVTAFVCVDIVLFDYSTLITPLDLFAFSMYPLLLMLFGLFIWREFSPKLNVEFQGAGGAIKP